MSAVEVLSDPGIRRLLNTDPNFERLRYLIVLVAASEPPFNTGGTTFEGHITFNTKQLWRIADHLGLDFERFRGAERVYQLLSTSGLVRIIRNEQTRSYSQYCATEQGIAQTRLNLDRLAKIQQFESQVKTMQMTIKKQFAKQSAAVFEIMLRSGVFTIGRDDSNDFSVKDPYMSSNHARIVYRNGEWIFEDLNSKNGSYKLGPQGLSRIMEQPVSDGDQYQLGSSIFRFRRPT